MNNYFTTPQLMPIMQQNSDPSFLSRFSSAFREGMDPTPMYIGLVVLVVLLVGLYYIFTWWVDRAEKQRGRKIDILETIKRNVKLNDNQERYLEALIEKFKNREPYNPEIKTEYLFDFLIFMVQNLTQGPTQTLRRKTHYIPDFSKGDLLEVMLSRDKNFTTERYEITGQDDRYINLQKPPSGDKLNLREDDIVSIMYSKSNLNLRGNAEVRQVSDDQIILFLPKGLHFEELRLHDRVPIQNANCELLLHTNSDNTISAYGRLLDISIGGAKVELANESNERIEKNMRGRIEFEIVDYGEIDTNIKIASIHDRSDEELIAGVAFKDLDFSDRELLTHYVNDRKDES